MWTRPNVEKFLYQRCATLVRSLDIPALFDVIALCTYLACDRNRRIHGLSGQGGEKSRGEEPTGVVKRIERSLGYVSRESR